MMNFLGRVISYNFRFAIDVLKINLNRIRYKVYCNVKTN